MNIDFEMRGQTGVHYQQYDLNVKPTIVGLPNELSMECFSWLGAKDLCRCARVCRLWKRVFEDDALWTRLLTAEWGKFDNTEPYLFFLKHKEIWRRLATTSYGHLSFPLKNACFEITLKGLVEGTSQGELRLTDFETGNREPISQHKGTTITSCVCNGSRIIYGAKDGYIVSVDFESEDQINDVFRKLPFSVYSLHLSSSGLFSGHYGTVFLWDLAKMTTSKAFVSEDSKDECDAEVCTLIASDTHLFFGMENGKIEIWDIATAQCQHRFQAHDGGIDCLQLVESHLYSCGDEVKVWDIKTGKCLGKFEEEGLSCFRVWGPKIFLGCYNAIKIIDLRTGELVNTLLSGKLDNTFLMRKIHIVCLGMLRGIGNDSMTTYSIGFMQT